MKELQLISSQELATELCNRFSSSVFVGCQDDGEKGQQIFDCGNGSIFAQRGLAEYIYNVAKLDLESMWTGEVIIEDD